MPALLLAETPDDKRMPHPAAAHVQSRPRAALGRRRAGAPVPPDAARCSAAPISSASRSKRSTLTPRAARRSPPRELRRHDDQSPRGRDQPVPAAARATTRSTGIRGATKRSQRARDEDKPILLSIGYSACHWCHVMAHESFEDPDVAAVMNDALRQHQGRSRGASRPRPDLPDGARAADAALGRLAAHDVPHAGRRAVLRRARIFRRKAATGCRGFLDLLPRVAAAYREQGEAIAEQSGAAARGAGQRSSPTRRRRRRAAGTRAGARARRAQAHASIRSRAASAPAPKFPHPTELEFCLRAACAQRSDAEALEIVRITLARMADGGIHDQLGGGFCRYSVDARMDDSALREDALRQRAAARPVRGPRARRPATRVSRTSRATSSAG